MFTHTEVGSSVQSQGVGGQLVRGALDHVLILGMPVCPFVQAWMARHPDYTWPR